MPVGLLDGLFGYLPRSEGPDQLTLALEGDDEFPLGYEGRDYDAHVRITADTVSHKTPYAAGTTSQNRSLVRSGRMCRLSNHHAPQADESWSHFGQG